MLQEGGPLPGPKTGLLSNTRKSIVQRDSCADKAREFQKNIYFCFTDYVKAFDHVDHNKLWKILKEMRVPDHLTCLQRNLYPIKK